MCVSLPEDFEEIKESIDAFKASIFGKNLSYNLEGSEYNKTGIVSAPIVGGYRPHVAKFKTCWIFY